MKKCILVYITVPDKKSGKKIITNLLNKKLIACGNLISEAVSFFYWKGKIQTENESIMILKTTSNLYSHLETEIKKLHPYKCPCIVALPIKEGYTPFLKWIEESCPEEPYTNRV